MAEVSATQNSEDVYVQVEARLAALRNEFESGEQRIRELELESTKLHDRLLMLSGAIQALQEMHTVLTAPNGLGMDHAEPGS